jgi:hypothetical protein
MSKIALLKSGLLSVILVALLLAVTVSSVSAVCSQNSISYYGEGVGACVQGTYNGDSFYTVTWNVGRWLGSCQAYASNLYFTLYANGTPMSGSTAIDYYAASSSGPFASIGAIAYSYFYDSRVGTFAWSSGYVSLP